jgi:hypothetical protein
MSKYTREMTQTISGEDRGFTIEVDVYDVLRAFKVTDPAVQHAVKKLLCSGNRGHKDRKQDLEEAVQSIERAIDVLMVEESFAEAMAAMCESPPDSRQLVDCSFEVGDMICPKVNPGDHWYICAVMADSMLLQKPGRNEDFTVPAVYYDCWQLCTQESEQPAECPFAVGDVIRSNTNPDALGWRIERVLEDKVEAVSDDGYKTPADVLRKDWTGFSIISKSNCPFKAGDVIQSVCWPRYVFRVINIRADDMTVDEERTGGRHRIPRCNWGAYKIKSPTAVDKPDATC